MKSKVDSRIILDQSGAENLLGYGDGLFIAPGGALQRVQAPMVTDEHVTAIVRFLKGTTQAAPHAALMSRLDRV